MKNAEELIKPKDEKLLEIYEAIWIKKVILLFLFFYFSIEILKIFLIKESFIQETHQILSTL